MDQLSKSFNLSLRGFPYCVDLSASDSLLLLSLEDLDSCQWWKGRFTAEDIEATTKKVGSVKKYPTFLKMLLSALEFSSETVDFEIFTYADVMRLRARQGARVNGQAGKESQTRYFILNLTGEFADKVHYPLPLAYDEVPDPTNLLKTISRLKAELEAFRRASQSPGLLLENQQLKQKLARFELSPPSLPRKPSKSELDSLLQEKKDIESAHESFQRDTSKEIRRLQATNDDLKSTNQSLQAELARVKTEMDAIIAQLEDESDAQTVIRGLKDQLQACESKSAKQKTSLEHENSALISQLETIKGTEKKLKLRISELEAELEAAMQRKNSQPRTSSASRRSPATARVVTPNGRSESRSSVRSSGSRTHSPSPSFTRKSPVRRDPPGRKSPAAGNRSRASPQRQRESPMRSVTQRVGGGTTAGKKGAVHSGSRGKLRDARDDLEAENSPRNGAVDVINERLAKVQALMKNLKKQ